MAKFAWRAAVQMFYIAVVVGVFCTLKDRGETLMVALFGLLYVTIRSASMILGVAQAKLAVGLQHELEGLRVLISPDHQIDWEARKQAQDGLGDGEALVVFGHRRAVCDLADMPCRAFPSP